MNDVDLIEKGIKQGAEMERSRLCASLCRETIEIRRLRVGFREINGRVEVEFLDWVGKRTFSMKPRVARNLAKELLLITDAQAEAKSNGRT